MIKDVEKRLAEYRAAKLGKSQLISKPPNRTQVIPSDENPKPKVPKEKPTTKKTKNKIQETIDVIDQPLSSSSSIALRNSNNLFVKYKRQLDILVNILKFIVWLLLMTVFIEVEFGAVFFIFSIFYLIYQNFRRSPKKAGELSAYSVFNPNCESIDGTLTAEQFERELIRGPKSLQ